MSDILLHITDEKEVAKYKSLITSINQLMKNMKKDTCYTMVNGLLLAMQSLPNEYFSNITKINITNKTLLKFDLNNKSKNFNGYINGKELYSFLNDYKTKITEFKFYKTHFVIETSLPEVEYTSYMITKDNTDIQEYKRITQERKNINKVLYSKTFDSVDFIKDIDSHIPSVVRLNDIKLKLNKSFITISKPKENKITIASYKNNDVVLYSEFTSISDKFECKSIFNIINY